MKATYKMQYIANSEKELTEKQQLDFVEDLASLAKKHNLTIGGQFINISKTN